MLPDLGTEVPETSIKLLAMAQAMVLSGKVQTEELRSTQTFLTLVAVRKAVLLPEHQLCTQVTASRTLVVVLVARVVQKAVNTLEARANTTASQPTMEDYPPTSYRSSSHASTSYRQGSHSTRRSSTSASGPSHSYASPSRRHRAYETGSNISSSTVTHPSAYDDSRATHTWHPPPRYQSSEASRHTHRSDAPSAGSRISYGRSAYGPHCSVPSDGSLLPPCHVHGYPPPPRPVLRARQGGNFSFIYSVMENVEDDSDVDHFAWNCTELLDF
jgi:hypothetical protein